MADQAQLNRPKEQGVRAWNAWRSQAPDTPIDLTRADLRGASLRLAEPLRAHRWANLR